MRNIFISLFVLLLSGCYSSKKCPTNMVRIEQNPDYHPDRIYTPRYLLRDTKNRLYVPKNKLEDYVMNHNITKSGKKYNNPEKVIRVIKWYDEIDKKMMRMDGLK